MSQLIKHILHANTFILSSDRFIYWEEKRSLILSDLHLGKSGYFRKNGIPIPQNIYKDDMHRLVNAIQFFKPENLIVVGDLFHSHINKEFDLFLKWRKDLRQLTIHLIKGNHDILPKPWYKDANIELIESQFIIDQFLFMHEKATELNPAYYTWCGHVHPSISLQTGARQRIRLPCFYFTPQYAILPAFGKFTGGYPVETNKKTSIYAILPANAERKEKGRLIKV